MHIYYLAGSALAGVVVGIVMFRLRQGALVTYPMMFLVFLLSFAVFLGNPLGLLASGGGLLILLVTGTAYLGLTLWLKPSK